MQSLNLSISTKPLGWILRENGYLLPFGVIPIESEAAALGDTKEWKEVKVIPTISILTSCDSEIVCPSDLCRKKLTKNHSFDAHIREHLGLKTFKSEALNTNHTKLNSTVAINYYCIQKGCIYSMSEGERFFTKLKYLKQHYLKVHAPKTFVCCLCQKSFGTAVFLDIHLRMCGHVFICSCKASYSTIEALQTHARRKNHDYDHAGYRNILRSVKHSNSLGKMDEEPLKDKVKEIGKITPPKTKKMHPVAVLLPRPNTVMSNVMATPWVYDDFTCSTLKVDFGTQTVPMLSLQHGQSSTSLNEISKLSKRKKSAETQTSQVRVRISTETQTANVIKRRRSNRKKQLAEAETQCHTEESDPPVVVNNSSDKSPTEQPKPKEDSYLDALFFAVKETTTTNGTNTTDNNIFDELNHFTCDIENSDSTPAPNTMESIFNELEEVHSQTQTDPYLFSGTDDSSIFEDFGVSLNVGDTDVSDFLNFVTTETQTLPGIVISPSIMNVTANSSPTDTANTQTIDNFGFLVESPENGTADMSSVFDDFIQCPKFSAADGLSSGTSYLETMDNETQTQCYDYSTMMSNMFGPD